MSLENTRLTRRSFSILGAGAISAASLLGIAAKAIAQDATPGASPEVADLGAFEGLDLTEIVVSATQYTYSASVPGAMPEGWYIITLKNDSDAVASLNLAMLPEGTSGGDLSSAVSQSFQGEGGEMPDWWENATFAGGNVAAAGASNSTLAYLVPGKWYMFSTNPASTQSPSSFNILTSEELDENYGITSEATPEASPVSAAPEGVVATSNVDVEDDSLTLDNEPAAAQQVLQVTNGGDQVHDVVILRTDDTLDESGAASLATSWAKGEETNATVLGGVGTLSPGATAFAALDVEPGTYIAFSSLPDENGGLQVDNGVVAIFSAQ
ncbi:MAG TPA: hypothetical protein VNZ58_04435 [Thermomicrobiales bacterium]|nr:hypothetical protein [Thermomicrobiales bacterium]